VAIDLSGLIGKQRQRCGLVPRFDWRWVANARRTLRAKGWREYALRAT
jgi:hypothetical protein